MQCRRPSPSHARTPTFLLPRPRQVEAKRAAAASEDTLREHFDSVTGLRAELIEAGIMDPDRGEIGDPRRICNCDEMPQFIDYNSDKGNAKKKVAAGKGDPAYKTGSENRECNTVDMIIGLDGFLYVHAPPRAFPNTQPAFTAPQFQ